MKCTAILNSKSYDLECGNMPEVSFQEVEVLTPSGSMFVLGAHSWNMLTCAHIPDELISDDEFVVLIPIDKNTYHQVTGCRVTVDKQHIFYRNSMLRLSKERLDEMSSVIDHHLTAPWQD